MNFFGEFCLKEYDGHFRGYFIHGIIPGYFSILGDYSHKVSIFWEGFSKGTRNSFYIYAYTTSIMESIFCAKFFQLISDNRAIWDNFTYIPDTVEQKI
jgi:hypothetical protein